MAERPAPPPPASAPSPEDARPARPRTKILVVDDSETVRLLMRTLLSRDDYEVLTARDGQEGVEVALAEKPGLILMDMMMPRMNGLDAVVRLRSEASMRDVPIIMVTTRSELSRVESGFASGCTDYVVKPFGGVELLAKVRSCLAAAREPSR